MEQQICWQKSMRDLEVAEEMLSILILAKTRSTSGNTLKCKGAVLEIHYTAVSPFLQVYWNGVFWGNGQVLLVVKPICFFFAPQRKDCRVLCATSECKNVVGFAFIACKFIFFNLTWLSWCGVLFGGLFFLSHGIVAGKEVIYFRGPLVTFSWPPHQYTQTG